MEFRLNYQAVGSERSVQDSTLKLCTEKVRKLEGGK